MKKITFFFALITAATFAQITTEKSNSTPFLEGLFQEFPNVRDISISNNQKEMYFTVESYKKEFSFIAVTRLIKGKWSKPEVALFSGKNKDLEPFLSPDNLKLYFASNRRIDSETPKKDMDIWYVERSTIDKEWSKPKNIGAIINTDKDEFYPAITNLGNLYFTASYEDTKGKEDIYISKFVDGNYTKPVSLSEAVNSKTYEFNAFVSPNEDLILFSSYKRDDSFGGTDLYMSEKDEKGNWTTAKNLGENINSNKIDYCPFLDFNTNTLYFTSEKSKQSERINGRKSINEILNQMNASPNGMSRIYKVNAFQKKID